MYACTGYYITLKPTHKCTNIYYKDTAMHCLKSCQSALPHNCQEIQWNPNFSYPSFFEPPDNSNQKSFPSPQSNTVILPPISRTIRFFEPIFVSLGRFEKSPLKLGFLWCRHLYKIWADCLAPF